MAETATAQKVMTIDNTDRQEQYVEKQKARGHGLGIVFQDAFLRGMVRAIVGTLLWVGTGHTPAGRVPEIVASRDRGQAGPNAPAQGLCLIRVDYEGRRRERTEEGEENEE